MQRDLFTLDPVSTSSPSGLFAEVVLDRPLDHAVGYAITESLAPQVVVGKRVRVPFGRGDRSMVGYCVGLTPTPPGRAVKEVLSVLDEEPLLTDELLRLTRWMADYYLCGWGQVLNAVVPAGARAGAGMTRRAFVELVPEGELTAPPGKLPEKQAAVLRLLRETARA